MIQPTSNRISEGDEGGFSLVPSHPEHGSAFDSIAENNSDQYLHRELQFAMLFLGLRQAVLNRCSIENPRVRTQPSRLRWIEAAFLLTDPV